MASGIFGTDGIRGRVNSGTMTAEGALSIALAAAAQWRQRSPRGTVLIGKDTRRSGYMLESAMVAGFTSMGLDVLLTGPLPTPAIGMLTRSMRADLGVMISASHNPHYDNGIKFFGPDGFKLSDAQESAIEAGVGADHKLSDPGHVGRATRLDGAAERYMEFAKGTFPRGLRLDGLKIVVDAANGAAFRTAPAVLWELGAEVIEVGTAPDGFNINEGCGSTAPQACSEAVLRHGADLGVSLDGDADRVHLVDETGRVVDGDQLMALIAERALAAGQLRGGRLVATVMSNGGLARHLEDFGIGLERAAVGDRHVMERMRVLGCNVGGEQSGHIILSDHTTTGDGLIAALQALASLAETDRPASAVLRRFEPIPQAARAIRTEQAALLLQAPEVRRAMASAERTLGPVGRLIVRPSGTEPMVRLMAEGEDHDRIDAALTEIETAVFLAGSRAAPAPAFASPDGALRAAVA